MMRYCEHLVLLIFVISARITINKVCASASHREEQFEKLEGKRWSNHLKKFLTNRLYAFSSKNI